MASTISTCDDEIDARLLINVYRVVKPYLVKLQPIAVQKRAEADTMSQRSEEEIIEIQVNANHRIQKRPRPTFLVTEHTDGLLTILIGLSLRYTDIRYTDRLLTILIYLWHINASITIIKV
jgi:hypothetical protein